MQTRPKIEYPYLLMNHHAIMLYMIRHNLKLLQQVSIKLGMPVRPLPPSLDPDPTSPVARLYRSFGKSEPVDVNHL